MINETTANTEIFTLTPDTLQGVAGGFDVNWKKVGEYAAPVLLSNPVTMPLGIHALNKPAAAQGAIWAAGGALAGSAGGPEGTALGAAGGGLAGYYGSLVGRDFPVK